MLKGGEKYFFCTCIWLKFESVLSVKRPINDFACEGFGKFAVDKGVIYGVWLTTVDAFTVCTYPIPAKFFLCSNNPVDKFELKFYYFLCMFCPNLSIC